MAKILGHCDGTLGCWWKWFDDTVMVHSDPSLRVALKDIDTIDRANYSWMTKECYERLQAKSKLPTDNADVPWDKPSPKPARSISEKWRKIGRNLRDPKEKQL